jgi:GR25 family glycosyltransferase involved in LPS biosynthesis
MQGIKLSEDLSKECIKSCQENGLIVKPFLAVYGDAVHENYSSLKLFPWPNTKDSRDTEGVRGCFISHFLLWKKCVELKKSILICEHDALMIRPLTKELIDQKYDVLNLDAHSRTARDYESHLLKNKGIKIRKHGHKNMSLVFLDTISIPGAHSYIITPQGAQKIIDFTLQRGMLPADIAINCVSCDLYKSDTSYFRINPQYWLGSKRKSKYSFTRNKDLARKMI